MEAINRNEIFNDSWPEPHSNTLSLIQFMEHSFIFFNIKFNFAGSELCYKTAKKKRKKKSKNVDMIVYLAEWRQFAAK